MTADLNREHVEALQERAGAAANAVFADAAKELTQPGADPAKVLQSRMMDRLRSFDLTQRAGTVLAQPGFLETKKC